MIASLMPLVIVLAYCEARTALILDGDTLQDGNLPTGASREDWKWQVLIKSTDSKKKDFRCSGIILSEPAVCPDLPGENNAREQCTFTVDTSNPSDTEESACERENCCWDASAAPTEPLRCHQKASWVITSDACIEDTIDKYEFYLGKQKKTLIKCNVIGTKSKNAPDNTLVLLKMILPGLKDYSISKKSIEFAKTYVNGEECHIYGWGDWMSLESGGGGLTKSTSLNIGTISSMGSRACRQNGFNSDKYQCAKPATSEEATVCKGDEGSPLVCNRKLVGTLHYREGGKRCFKHEPVVYTRLSEECDWLRKETCVEVDPDDAAKCKTKNAEIDTLCG